MSEIKVDLKPNGPMLVEGLTSITASDGTTISIDKPVCALCRCGLAQTKPFCDGAHSREGWKE